MHLSAKTRNSTKKSYLALCRKAGNIPAVVYGPDCQPRSILVDHKDFAQVYDQAGESSLIDFSIDGSSAVKVLIKDAQHDPVTEEIIHVDFLQVDMNKPIEAEVEINFKGQAPAVKEFGGILNKQLSEISIKCLPADLIHEIVVDLSRLATFDDVIHVKDLFGSEKVEIINNPEDVVVSVSEPLSEEELTALEAAAASQESDKEILGGEKENKKLKDQEMQVASASNDLPDQGKEE